MLALSGLVRARMQAVGLQGVGHKDLCAGRMCVDVQHCIVLLIFIVLMHGVGEGLQPWRYLLLARSGMKTWRLILI